MTRVNSFLIPHLEDMSWLLPTEKGRSLTLQYKIHILMLLPGKTSKFFLKSWLLICRLLTWAINFDRRLSVKAWYITALRLPLTSISPCNIGNACKKRIQQLNTFNPFYTDVRYNDKIHDDNLTGTFAQDVIFNKQLGKYIVYNTSIKMFLDIC